MYCRTHPSCVICDKLEADLKLGAVLKRFQPNELPGGESSQGGGFRARKAILMQLIVSTPRLLRGLSANIKTFAPLGVDAET